MPTYVMLSTLGPDGWETLRQNPDRITAVRDEVEGLGLRVIAQYALMGQYDFLNIIEASDEQAMAECVGRLGEIDPHACREHVRQRFDSCRIAEDYARVYADAARQRGGRLATA